MITFISCLLFAFLWLISWLPLRILYLFSDVVFFFFYFLFPYRKKLVFENLRIAFPEKNSTEINSIAKKFYKHLADSVIESFYMIHMSLKENTARYQFKNLSLLDNIYNNGQSIILLMPHYGNWEWLAGLESKTSFHFLAVYKPLTNKCFDRMFIRNREKFGFETVPMNKILRKIVNAENKHDRIISFFLYDQRPLSNELNYWLPFLNQNTPVLLGAEKIAKKFNQPVVFLKTRRVKRGYYENEFIEIFNDPESSEGHEITEKYYALLEGMIKEYPEYWLWSHARWKFTSPV